MKISVIIPVYNGEETVVGCLDAIMGQDYPKEDYEVIVIDDGSADGTREAVKRYPVRLIEIKENMGRIVARETGALAASNDLLFFMDSRVIAEPDVLRKISEIDYQPLAGGDWNERELKYRSSFDALFYLLRKKMHRGYYPQCEYPDRMPFYYINEGNFDRVPKGLTAFFVEKGLFLSSLPPDKGKGVNDDTRVLREIVKKKDIMRHSDVRLTYLQRSYFREVMRHIYERGPRFADYYLAKGGRYRIPYMIALFGVFAFLVNGISYPRLLLYGAAGLFLMGAIFAVWLAENIRDFFIAASLLPPVAAAFALGVLRWQIRRFAA